MLSTMLQEMKNYTHFTEGACALFERKSASSSNYSQKIGLIDGCPFVMQGIEALLNTLPVSLSVNNLSLRDHGCDSIFLDNNFDVVISGLFGAKSNILNGFISLDKIKRLNPDVRVIVVTQTKNKRLLDFLVNMGADALISCDDSLDEMKRVMMCTLQNKGKRVCSQMIKVQLPRSRDKTITNISPLTVREIKVINAILNGYDLNRISQLAARSVKTISHYKRSAMRKLRVNSNAKMLHSIQIPGGPED